MTKNYIIEMVEAGRLPVDELCVLSAILSKQRDPAAAVLLNYVDEHALWKRWGFTGWDDYVGQIGVPDAVLRCSAVLSFRDGIEDDKARRMGDGVKREILRLLEDNPMAMTSQEFEKRLEVILAESQKHDAEVSRSAQCVGS